MLQSKGASAGGYATPATGRTVYAKMTPIQWSSVPDNPRQRDTVRHLKRAKHLYEESPTHSHVSMAICPDGSKFKLDGHTRALLWTQRPDLAPPFVHVTCFYVGSIAEVVELYGHFDAREALETASDKVSGAYHEIDWNPQSSFLQTGAITVALRLTEGIFRGTGDSKEVKKLSIYALVPAWQIELQMLDSINPVIKNRRWNQATVTAALLTLRRRGQKAQEFWDLFNRDVGVKLESEMDGVEAANRLVRQNVAVNRSVIEYSASRFVSAFESWRRGHTYKNAAMPKATNLIEYMKVVRKEEI